VKAASLAAVKHIPLGAQVDDGLCEPMFE
jgi:hypothetical protein